MSIDLLLALLTDENGISEEAYGFLRDSVVDKWGQAGGNLLSRVTDATDGRFYISGEKHELLEIRAEFEELEEL